MEPGGAGARKPTNAPMRVAFHVLLLRTEKLADILTGSEIFMCCVNCVTAANRESLKIFCWVSGIFTR